MPIPNEKILLTIILFSVMVLVIFITKRAIRKFSFVKAIDANRRKVIFNISYLLIYITVGSFLAVIWGVDYKQVALFFSSIIAVLGVALFAQLSILSNLTASMILFFSHPMRIGDRIRVMDKDFDWTGEVTDITGFYLFMKTDKGPNITLPTSLVMQKGIEILTSKKRQKTKLES